MENANEPTESPPRLSKAEMQAAERYGMSPDVRRYMVARALQVAQKSTAPRDVNNALRTLAILDRLNIEYAKLTQGNPDPAPGDDVPADVAEAAWKAAAEAMEKTKRDE